MNWRTAAFYTTAVLLMAFAAVLFAVGLYQWAR